MTRAARTVLLCFALGRVTDALVAVGATVLVVQRTDGAGWVAVVVAARLLPGALLSLPAVSWVRGRERLASVLGLSTRAGVAVVLVALPDLPVAVVVGLVALAAVAGAPTKTAAAREVAAVTPEPDLAAASVTFTRTEHGVTLLGAGLAGGLVLLAGARADLVAATALAAVAVAALLAVPRARVATGAGGGARTRLRASAVLVLGIRGARGLLAVRFGGKAALGVVTVTIALLPARAGVASTFLGGLQAAMALGAVVAAVAAGRFVVHPTRWVPLAAAGALALALAALSAAVPLVLAVVVLVVVGAADLVTHVAAGLALPRVVPTVTTAAASGVADSVSAAGLLVGTVAAPLLVAGFGVDGACLVAAVVAACAVVLAAGALGGADPVVDASADDRAVALRRSPLGGLPPLVLGALADLATGVPLRRGELAVAEGAPADAVYVVASGRLAVHVAGADAARGGRMTTLQPGDLFGEIGVLHARPRTASVVALDASVLVRVPGPEFAAAVGADGQVARDVGRDADHRLDRSHR